MPQYSRIISTIGLCISSFALGFQIRVLEPWHKELSNDFKKIEENIINLNEEFKKLKNIK